MADIRLIYRERLHNKDKEKARLSYEDLFEVKPVEEVDYHEVLERNNIEWTRRLNDSRQQAIKEGYEAGIADGEFKARQRIDEQLHHFENALMELDNRLRQTIEELKPGITSLVFDIAEKVIGVSVENEPLQQWVTQTISSVLSPISEHAKIEITVAEFDFESVKTLISKLPRADKILVTYSKSLKPGEFKIETPQQAIVNNFAKKLTDLRQSAPLTDWGK